MSCRSITNKLFVLPIITVRLVITGRSVVIGTRVTPGGRVITLRSLTRVTPGILTRALIVIVSVINKLLVFTIW